jgi:hypothetical protein
VKGTSEIMENRKCASCYMTSWVYRKFLGDLLREKMVEYLYAFLSFMSHAVSFVRRLECWL